MDMGHLEEVFQGEDLLGGDFLGGDHREEGVSGEEDRQAEGSVEAHLVGEGVASEDEEEVIMEVVGDTIRTIKLFI